MALQSIELVVEAYVNNLSYETNNSVSEASAFIAALQEIVMRRPVSVTIDGNSVRFDYSLLKSELDRARLWMSSRSNSSSVNGGANRIYDQSNIRGY